MSIRDVWIQSLNAHLRFLSTPILLIVAFTPILLLGTLTARRFIQSKVLNVWLDSAYASLIIACLLIVLACIGIYLKNRRSTYVLNTKKLRDRSPDPIKFDQTVQAFKQLSIVNAPSYVVFDNGQVFRRDSKLWSKDEFLLFLLANKALRRAIQPDNTIPVHQIYFNITDLERANLIPNSKKQTSDGEEEHSGFCAYVKALMSNEEILDTYASYSENWQDKNNDDYKFKLTKDEKRYHNAIMHFHENKPKLRAWFTYERPEDVSQLNSSDRDTFENELAKHLGVDKNPTSNRITKLRYGRYRAMNRYLFKLNFIDESLLPKRKTE